MKNLLTKLKLQMFGLIVAVFLICLLGGCGGEDSDKLKIQQDITTDHDYDNCIKQYRIQTAIHIVGENGWSKECIYIEDLNEINLADKDSVAKAEYKKAEAFKKRVKECFGDDI